MKNTNLSYILILIILHSLVSCGDSKNDQILNDADNIIEGNPTAALNLLSEIKSDQLTSDEFAYYALLYTQAQIKCGITVSSDSLIQFAYRHYKYDTSGDLPLRANFYNAKVAYNRNDLQTAMKYGLTAYDIAKEDENIYWIAKSAELISDIFFDVYNYPQAETYTKEAIRNYKLAGKELNQRYALCDLATIFLNGNKDEAAITLMDSLYNASTAETGIDENYNDYLKNTLIAIKIKTGRPEYVDIESFPTITENSTDDEIIESLIINSQLSRDDGNFDNSRSYIDEATLLASSKEQQAHILYETYLHAKATDNYKYASFLADSLLILQSNIAEALLNESITGIQSDFYSEKARINRQKSKFLSFLIIVVIFVATTITFLLIRINRLKLKSRDAELETAMTSLLYMKSQSDRYDSQLKFLRNRLSKETQIVSELKKELGDKQHTESENIKIIETLFKEKWSTLNMLCNEYFEKGKSENTRNSILHNIENELKKLRSPKSLKQLENAVDNYLGGIMSCLRNECPYLKESDYTFLSLVFAGFSVRAVCLFTDIKYKLFYLKKSRLTKRISDSEAPHKKIFLEKLS